MGIHRDARLLVGGFTDNASDGPARGLAVHHVRADGEVDAEGRLGLENPTWIVEGKTPGLFYVSHSARRTVSAVTVDSGGELALVDQIDIAATNPAHVAVDPTGTRVIASCFTEGVVVELALGGDGLFRGMERTWDLTGAAATATRRNALQSEAEPHQAVFAGDGSFLVPDRAQDVVWRITADGPEAAAVLRPGSGPRHLALHPDAPYAYMVGELDSTLITFERDGASITPVDVRSTLPHDWFGDSAAAAISVDAARERVYVSNRGHETVAIFDISAPGAPQSIGWIPVRGRTPRFVGLLPDLDVFAIAAQGSHSVDLLSGGDAARGDGDRVSFAHAAPTCVVSVPTR